MSQAQATGTIVQCIGAVIDIEFPREGMPGIYDALVLEESGQKSFAEKGLTFEVEQQLGDGIVRCIALGSSDGLRRGMKVKSTGGPISLPVGASFGLASSGFSIGVVSGFSGTVSTSVGPDRPPPNKAVRKLVGCAAWGLTHCAL